MVQDKDEQDLEEYLQGESSLSAAYRRASAAQPSAAMDEAILAASRRAVQSKPGYAFSPFATDWHRPVALAAVLVLSVSVTVFMQYETDKAHLLPPAGSPGKNAVQFADDAFSRPALSEPGKSLKDRAVIPRAPAKSSAEQGFALPPAAADAAPTGLQDGSAQTYQSLDQRKMERLAKPAMNMPAEVPGAPAPSGVYEGEMSQAPDAAKTKEMKALKRDAVEFQMRREADTQPAAATPAPGGAKSRPYGRLDQAAKDAVSAPLSSTVAPLPSAEQWLVNIRQLWLVDQRDAAVQQLRLFNEAYPDFPRERMHQYLDQNVIDAANIQP